MVDRSNLLETGMDEIKSLENKFICLSVQFYEELAEDYGGPRKEFFTNIMREIKEKYFDGGICTYGEECDYYVIGIIFGLSLLQNGPVPKLPEDHLQEIFITDSPKRGFKEIRRAYKDLGIYQIAQAFPTFIHLFRISQISLTFKKLVHLLAPSWAEEGTNALIHQKKTYQLFMKYLRQAHGGKRPGVSLSDILRFVTGSDVEPLLGYGMHPSLHFSSVVGEGRFLPTSNTCINRLTLPVESSDMKLPAEDFLFNLYDFAFSSQYFGQL